MRVRSSHWFHRLDVAASLTWIGSRFALLVLGTVVVTRQRGARVVSLAVLPITWLLATHLLTFGDARFRIPVLPLDWTFEAAGIVTFLEWMARRCTAESPRPVAPTQVMSSIR